MNNNSLYEIFDNGGVRIAVIGALFILAIFLLVETINITAKMGRSGVPATDTITVQGDGKATMPPDVAKISFTVDNISKTVAQAQDSTTKQTNKAIDFVKEQGVEDKDIKTLSYNISPRYSYPNPCQPGMMCPDYYRESKITGYQVSQTIQVTMRDLAKVGDLLEGLGKLEVQNVSGPSFTLDDSTAGYTAARADAIGKAKAQAELLADQLGVRLGKIVNFSEFSGGYPYPMMYGMGGDTTVSKLETPNIPTGENTYNASVSITYEIR